MNPATGSASPLSRPALWATAGLSAAILVALVLAVVLADLETASWVASLGGVVLSAVALVWSVVSLKAGARRRHVHVEGGRGAAGRDILAPGATPSSPSNDAADDADIDVRSGPDGIAAGRDIIGVNLDPPQ
ncbi:hypothetical protein [Streptomyces sp. KS 21]|uniref:hypothetical protein n=1 Tax=Streptomyces sp. KS 21 TaxID=2485150 RepID=UPI0010644834|nr:hypothetical protein [Streptomyces sp. KS 21]TDU67852.1 hypothetical protein EDD91_7911 [Streptomyces sp. KS 21]